MSSLAARSEGAAYYHFGDDHVVRAISEDYRIVARQDLEERHMAAWASQNGGEMKARSAGVDETALLDQIAREQNFMKRRAGMAAPAMLEERQNCGANRFCAPSCTGSCICQLSGQFGQRCLTR